MQNTHAGLCIHGLVFIFQKIQVALKVFFGLILFFSFRIKMQSLISTLYRSDMLCIHWTLAQAPSLPCSSATFTAFLWYEWKCEKMACKDSFRPFQGILQRRDFMLSQTQPYGSSPALSANSFSSLPEIFCVLKMVGLLSPVLNVKNCYLRRIHKFGGYSGYVNISHWLTRVRVPGSTSTFSLLSLVFLKLLAFGRAESLQKYISQLSRLWMLLTSVNRKMSNRFFW